MLFLAKEGLLVNKDFGSRGTICSGNQIGSLSGMGTTNFNVGCGREG